MVNFNKLRLPYRQETAFSLLAFTVFLVPLAFSVFAYESFESIKFSFLLLGTGLSALLFVWPLEPGEIKHKQHRWLFLLMAGFFLWAVITAVFASDKLYAIFGFYYRFTSGLFFYAAWLVFLFLLVQFLDAEKLKFILKIVLFDALLVAVVSFLQSFGWIFYAGLQIDGFFRGPSLLGNTNYSAMFLACALPFAVYFLSESRKFQAKIYYSVTVFFLLLGCLMLASRGAILGIMAALGATLALLWFFQFPKKIFWGLLLASAVIFLAGNLFVSVSRPAAISSIVTTADNNTFSRLYAWTVSLNALIKHPLVGSGLGNYPVIFERLRGPEMASQIGVFDDAHNLFLHLAATGGAPLALLFSALVFLGFWSGLKSLKKQPNHFTLALLGSLCAWVIAAVFNPVPVPMFVLLAVLLGGLILPSASLAVFHFKHWQKFLLLTCAGVLVVWGAGSLVGEHVLGLTRSAYINEDYARSYNLAKLADVFSPTNEIVKTYLAGSSIALNKSRQEIIYYITAGEKLHPYLSAAPASASRLYYLLYLQSRQPEDLSAAANKLRESLKLDPFFAERYGQLALYEYEMGDLPGAERDTKTALSLDREIYSGWLFLAKLYQTKNNRLATLDALNQAFKLNSNPQLKYLIQLGKILPDIQKLPLEISVRTPQL